MQKVLDVRNRPALALINLVKELEQAFEEGWRLPKDFGNKGLCRVVSTGWYQVGLEKPDEVVETETVKEEVVVTQEGSIALEVITKKKDLLEFAEKEGIDVPTSLKYPAEIKAFLEKELNK